MTNQEALAKYLNISIEEADTLLEDCDYIIYTNDEADEAAKESILNSAWAFNADFIIEHSEALDHDTSSFTIIKAIQEQCEDGNAAILRLINDKDEFVVGAISADGRGHFLSAYDGDEIQLENGTFAYRQN